MTMVQANTTDPKAFTGKTVLAWFLGFFGVVFAANAVFLYLAFGSFPGVVVNSSYEAGQTYNQEISAARAQAQLNWQITSEITRGIDAGGRLLVTAVDAQGTPIYGVSIHATLRHPAQENADLEVSLRADGGGRYLGEFENLPEGNWTLVLEVKQDGIRKFKSENRVFVKD
jgi:nitrogen fixation protein FixH